jgi:hypothetical protein
VTSFKYIAVWGGKYVTLVSPKRVGRRNPAVIAASITVNAADPQRGTEAPATLSEITVTALFFPPTPGTTVHCAAQDLSLGEAGERRAQK